MEKYEIDLVDFGDDHFIASLIGMLTGHELAEIIAARGGSTNARWKAKEIRETIANLGFNCSRFKKFDKNTEYPCIMRSHDRTKKESGWYAAVYYDGIVYLPFAGLGWNHYNHDYPHLRVTTMLQVWI